MVKLQNLPLPQIAKTSKQIFASGVLATSLLVAACSEAPQPVSNTNPAQPAPTGYGGPPPQTAGNTAPGGNQGDTKPVELPPVPEEIQKLEKQYAAKSSDPKAKADLIKAKMTYGNECMNSQTMDRKVKYRVALKMYREVLALDPGNQEAQQNKDMIESIYKQMGRPIPS